MEAGGSSARRCFYLPSSRCLRDTRTASRCAQTLRIPIPLEIGLQSRRRSCFSTSARRRLRRRCKRRVYYRCGGCRKTRSRWGGFTWVCHAVSVSGILAHMQAGMATRMAYNLGLNLDCAAWVASRMITEQDAEVRRITWWACYKLDKCVCRCKS